jgi:hypothetical protein
MRPVGLVAMVIALASCGCVDSLQSQQPPNKWTTGFWFWSGSSAASAATSDPLDVVFFHAGTIRKESGRYATAVWSAYGHIPDELPAAREYWAVFRSPRSFTGQNGPMPTLNCRIGCNNKQDWISSPPLVRNPAEA